MTPFSAITRVGSLTLIAAVLASCDEPSWHLGAIARMQTPLDPALVCPLVMPQDSHALERAACAFGPGASVADTLGLPPDLPSRIPVRHIIVLMKENRSFDHIFGTLHDEGQPGVEAIPQGFANADPNGILVPPMHAATTCIPFDLPHGFDSVHASVAGGSMGNFVISTAQTTGTDGHAAISYNSRADLPFYYWLASTYAINDRHFSSVMSGTDPNRDFLLLATNDGQQDTGAGMPDTDTRSIFRALMDAGFTWGVYSNGTPLSGTLKWDHDDPGTHTLDRFLQHLDAGTLPNVAFVDGRDDVDDDHPPGDLQAGEAFSRTIYEHAIQSPQWPRLAIIWTYDECGGFADHIPPPQGCVARQLPQDQPYYELGPRVPLVVISPYARPHYVSHVQQDHTAVTRFIETVFDLPALTARDANSDALLDMFDFSSCAPPFLPAPTSPLSGTNGCH